MKSIVFRHLGRMPLVRKGQTGLGVENASELFQEWGCPAQISASSISKISHSGLSFSTIIFHLIEAGLIISAKASF
jgi:hypothetical protein